MDGIRIRTAFPQDSEQIRDIYAPYVEKTAITFETEVPTVTEMIHRMENVIWRYPYLVIEDGESILGYAYASPFIGRAAYDWSVEMSIYLRMDERRHRLGKMLYQKMEDVLRAQGILNLNACIAVPKADGDAYLTDNSMKFHEHMGMTAGTNLAVGTIWSGWRRYWASIKLQRIPYVHSRKCAKTLA